MSEHAKTGDSEQKFTLEQEPHWKTARRLNTAHKLRIAVNEARYSLGFWVEVPAKEADQLILKCVRDTILETEPYVGYKSKDADTCAPKETK